MKENALKNMKFGTHMKAYSRKPLNFFCIRKGYTRILMLLFNMTVGDKTVKCCSSLHKSVKFTMIRALKIEKIWDIT